MSGARLEMEINYFAPLAMILGFVPVIAFTLLMNISQDLAIWAAFAAAFAAFLSFAAAFFLGAGFLDVFFFTILFFLHECA